MQGYVKMTMIFFEFKSYLIIYILQGYFNRALICSLYHALGRASELSLLTWRSVVYNTTLLAPELMWKERKTGKSAPLSFFPDAFSYSVDWCHCMFCYLVSDGGGLYNIQSGEVPDGKTFVFPSLRYQCQKNCP